MSAFRFLHCADLHLDSPMAGVLGRGEVRPELFTDATRRSFARLIDLAIEQDVAFAIIAGDIWDGDWKDHGAGLFFNAQMRRLAPRPVFVVRGNHDAASVITKHLTLPPNVHVFATDRPETVTLGNFGVALHGQSFAHRAVTGNLAVGYPAAAANSINIGVLHTALESNVRDRYAPCSVADLASRGYEYWALGHVHEREIVSRAPWIVFPGNVQGRGVHEPGAKGGMIAQVANGRVVDVVFHATDVLRWADVPVPLHGVDTVRAAKERVCTKLESIDGGVPLVVRLRITGRTALHGALAGLRHEWVDAASAVDERIEIERIVISTEPAAIAADDDQMSMLAKTFAAGVDDAALATKLLTAFRKVGADAGLPSSEAELRAFATSCWHGVEQSLQESR